MIREEEILQQAKAYAKANRLAYPEVAIEHGFIHGAEWSDEHPVRNTFACISLVSAEQAKKQMIDRACEWLRRSTILADTTIERFKQAMEE